MRERFGSVVEPRERCWFWRAIEEETARVAGAGARAQKLIWINAPIKVLIDFTHGEFGTVQARSVSCVIKDILALY